MKPVWIVLLCLLSAAVLAALVWLLVWYIEQRVLAKSLGRASEGADAQAAWEHLRGRERDPARRFLYGHSLGGAVAIELATRNDDVAGVIVESSFTSIRDMVDALGYTSLSLDGLITQRFDSLAKVPAVSAPILFVHGTADRFVPPAMTERLYAAARDPKRLLLIANGTHRNSTDVGYEKYLSAVRELVELARRISPTRTATPGRSG